MLYMDDFETYPIPSQTQAVFYYKTQQDFDQNTFSRGELIRRNLSPGAVPMGWPVPWNTWRDPDCRVVRLFPEKTQIHQCGSARDTAPIA